jgi:hypothetical protein
MLPEKILKEALKKIKNPPEAKEIRLSNVKAKKLNRTLEEILISDAVVDEVELYEAAGNLLDAQFIALKGREIKKKFSTSSPVR